MPNMWMPAIGPSTRARAQVVAPLLQNPPAITVVPRLAATRVRSQDNGSGDVNFKDLSPEARKIFKEAQENILALNSARMRALKELKSAHEKIAELERRLEDAASQVGHLSPSRQADDGQSPGLPGSADRSPPEPSSTAQEVVGTIILVYKTGWEEAFVHHQTDDKPWTHLPGERMGTDLDRYPGRKVIRVEGNRMEFVLTNGTGKFDTRNPYDSGIARNYLIDAPGTWELVDGSLRRLS